MNTRLVQLWAVLIMPAGHVIGLFYRLYFKAIVLLLSYFSGVSSLYFFEMFSES